MLGDHYICSSVLVLYVATFLHHTALFTLDVPNMYLRSTMPNIQICLFRFARSNEKKKKKK